MIDIYVLDDEYKRSRVIDIYESLIWTERFNTKGDFELNLSKEQAQRFGIKEGEGLSIDDSTRIMVIHTIVEKDDDEDYVTVSGPAFEKVLGERVLKEALIQRKPGDIPKPNTGEGITSSTVMFQTAKATNSVPQGAWSATKPATIPEGQVLWVRVATNFTNGATDMQYRVIYDKDPGKVESSSVSYVDSTSQSSTSKTWSSSVPTGSGLGQYIWRAETTKYTNGESRVVYQSSSKGSLNGTSISGGQYLHIAFADSVNGGTSFNREWVTGRLYIGTYKDTVQAGSSDKDSYTWRSISEEFNPDWVVKDTPQAIANMFYEHICIQGVLDPNDRILPRADSPYLPGTIPFPTDPVEVSVSATLLISIIEEICDSYDLGYRMGLNSDSEGVYFEIYSGNRRTSDQYDLDPVIFSPQLNNLSGISEVTSTKEYRNVAYVSSYLGITKVYPEEGDQNIIGLKRRVLLVDGSKVSEEDKNPLDTIEKLGREELRKAAAERTLDGNIPENVDARYETGDIVEMRSAEGLTNEMRVTERIIVCDKEGKRVYPTLTTSKLIVPGTWDSWEANVTWDEAYGTWSGI